MTTANPFLASCLGITSCAIFFTMNYTLDLIAIPGLLLPPPPPGPSSSKGATPLTADGSPATTVRPPALGDFSAPASQGTRPATPIPHILRQWQHLVSRGHLIGPNSAVISTASYLYAAYCSESHSTQLLTLRNLYIAAAISAFAVIPFTILVIIPVNNDLQQGIQLANTMSLTTAGKRRGKADDDEDLLLLARWTTLNQVRATMALVAAGLALWALLM